MESENEQEQAKLSQVFCTKVTSELQGKNILHIIIETKAGLQLIVRDKRLAHLDDKRCYNLRICGSK